MVSDSGMCLVWTANFIKHRTIGIPVMDLVPARNPEPVKLNLLVIIVLKVLGKELINLETLRVGGV